MENIRAIKTRIKSMESTRQITRSMKMIAASKLRRTQSSAAALSDYARSCREMLSAALSAPGRNTNPFLRSPSGEKGAVLYVLFVGSRGLCGTYNTAVLNYLRELTESDPRPARVAVCGRWGREQLAASGIDAVRTFDISDTPTAAEAAELADYLKREYEEHRAGRVVLVYQQFRSVLSQSPGQLTLFPVEAVGEKRDTRYIFEPDRAAVLSALTEQYIFNTVYSVLLEAKSGEHASRMAAMTAASDNTDTLIGELTLALNHARQSAITTEISEIAGAAALQNS